MKTTIAIIAISFASLFLQQVHSQITVESEVNSKTEIEQLKEKKETVKTEEKEKLKAEVADINERLEKGKISAAEAEKLKKEAAEKRARNIEDRLDIIDSQIALLERNEDKSYRISIGVGQGEDDEKEEESDHDRTTSGMTFAFGLNNALIEGQSLDASPYKIGGSRFFEIGYEFTTALTDFMAVRYGISFQFNGLKPEGNQYFVEKDGQTLLEDYPVDLEKSKLRNDNLVVPIHLELTPFGANDDSGYSNDDRFKIGFGGYLGFNLGTLQKLKLENNDDERKIKLKEGYHTTNFVYGLSAYLGYDSYALYVKYDLNPVFTDNLVEEHNVSLGVRVAF